MVAISLTEGVVMRLAMRFLGALLTAATLFAVPAAFADKFDLSTIKCKDFVSSGKDNIAVIITWLDGYYKEKDDPPIIDFDKFKDNAEKLGKYCGDNPTDGLITAADQVLGK
jgi:acid stress chaperone HdeB